MTKPIFRKIMLVGLGGSGQKIVLNLKRLLIDLYGVVPPSIKMLCLDTDVPMEGAASNVRESRHGFDPQEFLHIKVEQPAVFLRESPAVDRWFVKPVPIGAITSGAGAIRQNGRLAFFHNLHEIAQRIDTMKIALGDAALPRLMNSARTELGATMDFDLSPKEMEVYVCGSLAGGTGSGTFLDMGILLRAELPGALIHGFFLLDWLYRRNAFANRVGGNVYAALAELDNLQSIVYGSERFIPYEVDYGKRHVSVTQSPYTLFHVIDGRNENGENINDVNQVTEIVARAIFLSVGSMGPAVASVVDNLINHINVTGPKLWQGKYARYSSLGVSSLVYPAPEKHRRIAAEQALRLCDEAIAELEGVAVKGDDGTSAEISADIKKVLTQAGYPGNPLGNAVRPRLRTFVYPKLTSSDLADGVFPTNVTNKQRGIESQIQNAVENVFAAVGTNVVQTAHGAFRDRIAQLDANANVSAAYRKQWVEQAVAELQDLHQAAAVAEQEAQTSLSAARARASEHLATAQKLPMTWYGGRRKGAAEKWRVAVGQVLTAFRDGLVAAYERGVLKSGPESQTKGLIDLLTEQAQGSVPKASQIVELLRTARADLDGQLRIARREVDAIQSNVTNVVIGRDGIVVPGEFIEQLRPSGEITSAPGDRRSTLINLSLQRFKEESKVYVVDDYLKRSEGSAEKLAGLFSHYAKQRLAPLAFVDIHAAMKFHADVQGVELNDFLREQFSHMVRLASPLWTYTKAMLDATRRPHYDRVVNIGVHDGQAKSSYEQIIKASMARFGIGVEPAFTEVGDPYRIWFLNYAAALPAYMLETVEENRSEYETEILPPYHLDRYFETAVPDLYPHDDRDNITLRILGMAIIPGVDIICDEKLSKGHKYTCSDPEIQKRNGNERLVWLDFRTMYDDVRTNTELLDGLITALRQRMNSLSRDDAKPAIQGHIERVRAKLEHRDFSKLVSARLTYQEIAALESFLSMGRGGFRMELERYISGN